jgi:hypothetical protein
MLSEPSKPSLPKNAVSPRHALLENLIVIANKHISEQFHDFALSQAGVLVDGDNMNGDVKEVQARIRAGNLLRTNHYAFMNLVTKELERAIRQDLADLRPGKKAAPVLDGPLSLVPFEEMDNKVTMGAISKPFEVKYSDALATLNVRLAFLLDRDILRVNQNPFRPEIFLGAVNVAWAEFVNDDEGKDFLMAQLSVDTFFALGAMYDALNLGLERKDAGGAGPVKRRRADSHDASMAPSRKKNQQAALAEQLRQFFNGTSSETPSKAPTGFDQLGDLDLSLPTLAVAPGLYGAPGHTAGSAAATAGAPLASSVVAQGHAPGMQAGGAAVTGAHAVAAAPGFVAAHGLAAYGLAGMPGVPATGAAAGGVAAPWATLASGVLPFGAPAVGAVPAAGGMAAPGFVAAPGAAAGMGVVTMPAGAGFVAAPGVAGVQNMAVPPGVFAAPGFMMATGGGTAGASGHGVEMLAGVAVPGVPGGIAVPAGGWVQGPAQGFQGGANNEAAQRMSLIGAKEPLMNYLAQLQRGAVLAGGATGGPAGGGIFVAGGMDGIADLGGLLGAATAMGASSGAWAPGAGGPGEAGSHMSGQGGGAAGGSVPAAGFANGGSSTGNVFFLPQIKQNAPQGSLSPADEGTIDLLSAVFDTVFRDQSISPEIRNLIRFLQIPVLKAALVDKNFFFQEAHPARRMIDLLSRMGWEQKKGPDDPLYQAMQKSVEKVGQDYEQELSVFSEAVNELEASLKAEETAAAAAIAEPIAAALKQEKKAVAAKSAKDAVALRIGTGEVVAIVETFLENKWTSVLTIAYSVDDEKPGAVKNATDTMDDLIWSVRPKITAEERKKLISKLPGLLSTLNKWLDVIKWQDADRLQFFAELAECHASIVRAPLEISPDRQLEISMEVARKDAERRLELQAKAHSDTPPPQDDDASIEVDSLSRGMWLEFEQEEGARKVKLAWISPLKTLYIFSTSSRQEAFSISGEALAQQFRDGTVRLVRSDGVVAQALSTAMGNMAAVNDPSHDQAGVA